MKKKVLLIIAVFLILGLLTGTGVYIYCFTDHFKSDKQIFYKYLLDRNEMISVVEKVKIPNDQNTYKANTDISYIYNYDNRIEKMTDDQIIKNLEEQIKKAEQFKGLNANIQSNIDKSNKIENHVINVKRDNTEILKMEAIRSEDSLGIKFEDVLNTYLGIENENIKELVSKFDIEYNDIDVPDKIDYDMGKYENLFKIEDNEKKHIINTYKNILYNEIPESCYIREKEQKITIDGNEYVANKNVLILNKEESINIGIKLLKILKDDDATLNVIAEKIKIINGNDEYGKIENITGLIQAYIDELEATPKTHSEYIRIEVYDYNGHTIKLDVSIEKEKKLEIDYVGDGDQKTLYIKQRFTQNDSPAIIYDLKTSILGANNITITTGKDLYKIEVILYDLEETYKRILKEKQEIYDSQSNMSDITNDLEDDGEIENIITEDELKNIKELYDKYSNMDKKMLRIGFNIEYVKNSNTNEEYTIYCNVCNTKVGARCNIHKEYTNEIGNLQKLDSKNCIFLNKYSKEQISGVIKLITDRIVNKMNEESEQQDIEFEDIAN